MTLLAKLLLTCLACLCFGTHAYSESAEIFPQNKIVYSPTSYDYGSLLGFRTIIHNLSWHYRPSSKLEGTLRFGSAFSTRNLDPPMIIWDNQESAIISKANVYLLGIGGQYALSGNTNQGTILGFIFDYLNVVDSSSKASLSGAQFEIYLGRAIDIPSIPFVIKPHIGMFSSILTSGRINNSTGRLRSSLSGTGVRFGVDIQWVIKKPLFHNIM